MLRALFLLSFVGSALYAGLIYTHAALSPQHSVSDEDEYALVLAIRPPAGDAASGSLRSWGPTLQALRNKQPGSRVAPQPAGDRDNRPVQAGLAVAALAPTGTITQEDRIGWAKVALAARVHDRASVSSPITHFYPAGSELEIIGRDGAWIELRDPATQARGWVLEQYVAMIDSPTATQVAAAEPDPVPAPEAATPKPKPAKAIAAKAKKRSVKPQAMPDTVLANVPRGRLLQRGERRGLGLFLFGRMAKLEAEGRVAR